MTILIMGAAGTVMLGALVIYIQYEIPFDHTPHDGPPSRDNRSQF